MSCATTSSLGAYAVGALEDRERDAVDAHVAGCRECLEELESLIAVASHLARVPADEWPAPPPAAVHGGRSRRRVLIAAAAVAAAIAALAVLLPLVREDPGADVTRVAAVDQRTGVHAAVEAVPRPWGTMLTVGLRGATPGERCRLLARARNGRTEVAATWTATYRGSADVTGAAAMTAADLEALDVVTTDGRLLVHVPMGEKQ